MAADQPSRDPLRELAMLAGDPDGLAEQARPLGPKPQAQVDGKPVPKRVEIADMVLPPAELVDELDNAKPAAAALAAEPDDEEVTLEFFGDDLPVRDFPLRYPFAWGGDRFEVIETRQLTTAEVGQLSAAAGEAGIDLYDIYSLMCRNKATGKRVPAKVLRKLMPADGLPIVDHLYDFSRRCFLVTAE